MKVTVESISTKAVPSKFGGTANTYSFYGSDGQWYSMGFKKPLFSKGAEVEFDFESTKYGNKVTNIISMSGGMVDAEPAARPAFKPTAGSGGFGSKGVFPVPPADGQRSIIRQNALTNARELIMSIEANTSTKLVNTADVQDAFAEAIIRIAKKFEAYTAGDTDAVAAAKKKASEETLK